MFATVSRLISWPRLSRASRILVSPQRWFSIAILTTNFTISFFVPGGAGQAGWTVYAPLSSDPTQVPARWGQTLFVLGLALGGTSSLMGAINYITTTLNMARSQSRQLRTGNEIASWVMRHPHFKRPLRDSS